MTTLGRWLAGILNAHIERHNVPMEVVHPDLAHKEKLVAAYLATLPPVRPCWACGDPGGFHVEHRPCWNVPPFKRNADQVPRTYGTGGLL